MSAPTLGEKLIRWAQAEPSVELLVLIGSHTRPAGEPAAADRFSDWDFQIATSRPEMFGDGNWTAALDLQPIAYVMRLARLGGVQKTTALFAEGELDLVLIPAAGLRGLAQVAKAGQHAGNPSAQRALTDLSAIIQGGYQIVKGAGEFAEFYSWVTREISPARLSDDAIRQLVDGFVCDYVSTRRKIERGEMLAAQRWLHLQLAETNFKLLHELRLREGLVSFPDARRIELFPEPRASEVTVEASPNAESLLAATEKSAGTCRKLVRALLSDNWQWPDLTPPR